MNFLFLESSRSWGGQEYRTCLEINWLNANGHAAWFIVDPDSEVFAKAREAGTRVLPLNLKQRFNVLTTLRLWKFCRAHAIDIVKTYSSKDHWLALPLYWAGWPLTRSRCITDPVGSWSRSYIFRHGCSKVVADAGVIKTQLVEKNGVDANRIEVIGSAVHLDKFNPEHDGAAFRQEFGVVTEAPLIVNIGMIRPDKGQTQLAEAAALVVAQRPDARFIFVGKGTGKGTREARLREVINAAGIADKVFMAGYRWNTPEILAAADIVAIASLHTEASPIVLREAFACGRAVVATAVGDVPEVMVDGENGLLVNPGSPLELATAILRFIDDDALRLRCANNALQFARKHFAFDQMMASKLSVDETLVNATRAKRRPR